MLQRLFLGYFRWRGWRVVGELPKDLRRAVIVGGAHTSNWDLLFTLITMFHLNKKFRFMIKKEALVFPLRGLLLRLGALPVERNSKKNAVDQVAQVINESEECFLCIAPEGTRKPVKDWKSGYYYIAKTADVPVMVAYLDYPKKTLHVGTFLTEGLTVEQSMSELKQVMGRSVPVKPKNFLY